jgi:hypothetical protein
MTENHDSVMDWVQSMNLGFCVSSRATDADSRLTATKALNALGVLASKEPSHQKVLAPVDWIMPAAGNLNVTRCCPCS